MQTEEKIRTFVATKISSELEKELANFIEELRKIRREVKWVKPESVHLTLKFLGNIPPTNVVDVSKAVSSATREFSNFQLTTGEKGAFPSLKRPRIFWLGLAEENDQTLIPLRNRIEDELAQIGFEKEKRKFHPHLTVGRVHSPKNIDEMTQKFMDYPFPEIRFNVDEILIMKSQLTPRGAIYSVQKAVPLN